MVADHLDRAAQDLLDVAQELAFLRGAERERLARLAGPAGAADAVDVGLRLVRDVEVDDVGDVVDVEPARRDVAGDQDSHLPAAELVERARALVLRLVAVDGQRGDPVALEALAQAVGAVLGAREDQDPRHRRIGEQVGQELRLVVAPDHVDLLAHGLGGRRRRRHRDPDRIDHEPLRQLGDLARHGGGEEQRLPLHRHGADDPLHVRQEAHVEHAVRLVEDEDGDRVEPDVSLLEQVEEASRGRDQDIDAAPERRDLLLLAHAAEDDRAGQGHVAAVVPAVLADLRGELAGGRDDEGARGARPRLAGQGLEQGQREGRRLAGPGLGAADEVPAGEHRRDGLHLDGGRGLVTLLLDGPEEGLGQAELAE